MNMIEIFGNLKYHNKKNYYLIFALLFSLNCIGFAQKVNKVKIDLDSKVIMYIDSSLIGENSVFELNLKSNKYKIDLLFSAVNSWNRFSIDTTVYIASDTVFFFSMPSITLLNSSPSDAGVYLNSQFIGFTPYYFNNNLLIDRGGDSLLVKKENYLTKLVSPNELTNNSWIKLIPDPSVNNSFINKNLKYLLLGSAVAFGSLSAYFKQEANKYFFSEEQSGRDSRLVNKYDTYSAIFSGMLQINFGVLVYLLLSE